MRFVFGLLVLVAACGKNAAGPDGGSGGVAAAGSGGAGGGGAGTVGGDGGTVGGGSGGAPSGTAGSGGGGSGGAIVDASSQDRPGDTSSDAARPTPKLTWSLMTPGWDAEFVSGDATGETWIATSLRAVLQIRSDGTTSSTSLALSARGSPDSGSRARTTPTWARTRTWSCTGTAAARGSATSCRAERPSAPFGVRDLTTSTRRAAAGHTIRLATTGGHHGRSCRRRRPAWVPGRNRSERRLAGGTLRRDLPFQRERNVAAGGHDGQVLREPDLGRRPERSLLRHERRHHAQAAEHRALGGRGESARISGTPVSPAMSLRGSGDRVRTTSTSSRTMVTCSIPPATASGRMTASIRRRRQVAITVHLGPQRGRRLPRDQQRPLSRCAVILSRRRSVADRNARPDSGPRVYPSTRPSRIRVHQIQDGTAMADLTSIRRCAGARR